MTRQRLRPIAALAALALPVSLAVIVSAGLASADTSPPPLPPVSTAPLTSSATGQSGLQAGSPTGDGVSASARPCTAPCSTTGSVNQGAQPVGVGLQSGHTASGSGDDGQAASQGAPYASGLGLAGESASSFVGPSGGSYTASGCLSVASKIPTSLPLSGFGNSCPTANGSGAGAGAGSQNGSGSSSAGGSPSGSSGSGASSPSGNGNGTGTGTGAGNGNGTGAGNGGAICPNPAAARTAAVPTPPATPGVPLTLLMVCAALGAGYALSTLRARATRKP